MRHVQRQIGARRAIAIDTHGAQFGRDDAVAQGHAARGIRPGTLHLFQGRQPLAPLRRAQALHAPAFLIHQNGRIPAHGGAQVTGQAAELIGPVHVAGKKDKAERIGVAEERALCLGQLWPEAAENRGPRAERRHLCSTGMQEAFCSSSDVQKPRAPISSGKPWARRR